MLRKSKKAALCNRYRPLAAHLALFVQFPHQTLLPTPTERCYSADHTPDWQQRAMQVFLDNFERYRKGEPLHKVVDKRRGY
jgi:hypothetical protein